MRIDFIVKEHYYLNAQKHKSVEAERVGDFFKLQRLGGR